MNEQEQRAVLSVCILAAFIDGSQTEEERALIKRIADGFRRDQLEVAAAYQDVLSHKTALAETVKELVSPEAKGLAYEMAVCVCNADGNLTSAERQFLTTLREALNLNATATSGIETQASLISTGPIAVPPRIADAPAPDAELDRTILNYAILNGALEMLPHSLATMAIIPLQMKMVYRIGQHFGVELSRAHITDFLATVGIGLTSQVVEGFARRLMGNLGRQLGGGLLGGLTGQATGSAVAFASTYALGQVAKEYYASGRSLSSAQLKEVFTSMLGQARLLQTQHSDAILQRSRQINVADLLPLVKGS